MTPDTTCSSTEMAGLLDVSGRRLQQLANEGAIPKPAKRGQYNLVATVRGYIKFLRDRAAGKGGGYAFEKERLTRLQADTLQAELRGHDERYVLLALVNERWADWSLTIRRHILSSSMTDDEKHDCLANIHSELVGKTEAHRREPQ